MELASCDPPDPGTGGAYRALTAHDTRFHALVAELAGSEQVRLALERTHCHLHIYRLYYDRDVGEQTLAEHRRITAAIRSGDADAAEQAMRDHLETAHHDRLDPTFADQERR